MFYYIINSANITNEMRAQTHSKNPRIYGNLECLKFEEEVNCHYEYMTTIPENLNIWLKDNGYLSDDII